MTWSQAGGGVMTWSGGGEGGVMIWSQRGRRCYDLVPGGEVL